MKSLSLFECDNWCLKNQFAIQNLRIKLTDSEWQAEHKFLNVFSPAAALPEAFFFLAGIFII